MKITLEEVIEQNQPMTQSKMFERIWNCDFLSLVEKEHFLNRLKDMYNSWATMYTIFNFTYGLYRDKGISPADTFFKFYDIGLNHPYWKPEDMNMALLCLVEPQISYQYSEYTNATYYGE